MPLSSTSFIHKSFKYDVFLSFRGEDTRKTFVDHLYLALLQKNINTFKDDKNMEKGDRITTELIKAIENSRFYIIVFSENYATSSWCLDELAKIIECQKIAERKAYPIFYDVEPTHVRKQSGVFGKGFDGRRMDEDAGIWIEALKEAANLSGWELKNTVDGHEGQFIQKVVEEISQKIPFIYSRIDENLVGMKTRSDAIISSLENCVDNVRMIGIWGIGGGGKTTLARAVFDLMSSRFEHKSFVENVRGVLRPDFSGLQKLQKQMLRDVLKQKVVDLTKFKISMYLLKVLVVLDDVDDIQQLEKLAQKDWFGPGSEIIITTRDEQVLRAHKVKLIHTVNELSDEEAICLFNWFAFKGEIPNSRYKELSQQFVHYAYGHPLTIKVLGLDLIDRDEDYWKATLEKLKTIPPGKVLNRLELSYMGLTDENKNIFLDVACFWKGDRKDRAIRALESCHLYPIVGLQDLERKSLITISEYDLYDDGVDWEVIQMHDRIQDMGREIVRREHPNEPYRRSRLWDDEEVEKILAEDSGCGETIGIRMTVKLNQEIQMNGLRKMINLKFLHLTYENDDYDHYFDDNGCKNDDNYSPDEVSQYFPNSLQYLFWKNCPFRRLANTFPAKYLVGLEMVFYRGEQLWENKQRKVLNKLKLLDLNYSVLTTLNLGVTPNLELLSVKGGYLKELHMPNIFPKLKSVTLFDSYSRKFDLQKSPNLETLNLGRCSHFEELHMPGNYPKLKTLLLGKSKLKSFDLGRTPNLEILDLDECVRFKEIHIPNKCPTLKSLVLWASNIKSFDFGKTPNLESLVVQNYSRGLWSKRDQHSNICTIDLRRTLNLNELVIRSNRSNRVNLLTPNGFPKLESLELRHAILSRTLDLGLVPNLEPLSREGCDEMVDNHMVLECPYLQSLKLSCSNLKNLNLVMSPHLETLTLDSCDSLVEISFGGVHKLKYLELFSSSKLESLDLRQCVNLESLDLDCSSDFLKLHTTDECRKLKHIHFEGDLRKLSIIGNIPEVLNNLGGLPYLEELIFSSTKIEHLLVDFCKLRLLRVLELESCHLLEKLPEDLGQLECLEELTIWSCKSLRGIPDDICNLKHLKYLCLRQCIAIEKLPEMLGSLESLRELDIEDTSINHLPHGIVLFKDLHIIGSRLLLLSCEFTSHIETSYYETFYHGGIHSTSLLYRAPSTAHDSSTMPYISI